MSLVAETPTDSESDAMTAPSTPPTPRPTPGPTPGRLAGAREVLAVPNVGSFLWWQGWGQAADAAVALGLTQVVLAVLEPDETPGALAAVLAISAIPLALGPIAGAIADRWDRRRTLVVANVVRTVGAGLAVVTAVTDIRIAGYLAAALLLATARVVYTIRAAALPVLVPSRLLVGADAGALLAGMIAGGIGGGIAIVFVDGAPDWVLAGAAGGYLASAIGFTRYRGDLGRGLEAGDGDEAHSFSPRAVWFDLRSRGVEAAGRALAFTASHRAIVGACFAAFVLAANEELDLEATGYAAAVAISTIGLFIGTVTAPLAVDRLGRSRLAIAAFAFAAVVAGTVAAANPIVIAGLGVSLLSFSFQNLRVAADAAVQLAVPERSVGRVFSIYDTLYNLAFVSGALLAIAFVGTAAQERERWVFAIGCGCYAIAAVVVRITERRRPW